MDPITTWGQEVAEIPIHKPPTGPPGRSNDVPSEDDMGFNDPQNVIYINMEGQDLTGRFRDRIKELEQMLQLTHQLATIHAGIQVKDRKAEGSLPSDDSDSSRWRRSQYRARVLDTYFQDGVYPWMFSPSFNNVNKTISVNKSEFHWELLATMLVGILIPRPLGQQLEEIFQSIGKTIQETNYTSDRRSFWSLLQVYTYDQSRDDLRASFRNVTYTLEQEMYTVSKNKSSQTSIRVNFAFAQNDYSFNETTWRRMKPQIESYIDNTGIGNITNPPSVPV